MDIQRVSTTIRRARRVVRKPPRVIVARLAAEVAREAERVRAPRRASALDEERLLRLIAAGSIDEAWRRVTARSLAQRIDEHIQAAHPVETERVMRAADRVLRREVDLLGSGPVDVGRPVNWHRDFKSGRSWPLVWSRRIDYIEASRPSDVKVPWELSRGQWLLPAAQAYVLTRDESYASAVREILEEWLAANPYTIGVNWAIAMEAAMRAITWSWLIGAFAPSHVWEDAGLRLDVLRSLYLHGDFIERNLERSDVNGNHYTADAVGLLVVGLALAPGKAPVRWAERGWSILCEEQRLQIHEDGVDFEGASAYHRLVGELFLVAALARETAGLDTPEPYRARLREMARFVDAYTRPDGSAPDWGDADDARVLPLGPDDLNDHRHLVSTVSAAWRNHAEQFGASSDPATVAWLLGSEAAAGLRQGVGPRQSAAFPAGGAFVLADGQDHVFVDCGPVGLAGRGGHGHNDCLSFEAVLDGTHLVADPGSYVYTASLQERNHFRSTLSHNTPMVDGAEQNRLSPAMPWSLGNDVEPTTADWHALPDRITLRASHSGFLRLQEPVLPTRTFVLRPAEHSLSILDEFEGDGDHAIVVPLHLARGIAARPLAPGRIELTDTKRTFDLLWVDSSSWTLTFAIGWLSPTYGVRHEATVLQWQRSGSLQPLEITIRLRGNGTGPRIDGR